MAECKNCKHFVGDCGHHFRDSDGHIHYDIPRESACDKYGDCELYEDKRSELEIAIEALKASDIGLKNKSVILQAIKDSLNE